MKFRVVSEFEPKGDQPQAIVKLSENIERSVPHQVLLGVTGSGKTYTLAKTIEKVQRPTLVFAPNKTLAAQLYNEFKLFFPDNAVEYFVSYYDYYQPEAYIPKTDTFIEKDSAINDEIDKMRHSATVSLLERRDTIIVASVSCIYGIGSPEDYHGMLARVNVGQEISREEFIDKLVEMRYSRNNIDFRRGTFRVNGDVVDVFPIYESEEALRVEFFGDEIESITRIDSLTAKIIQKLESAPIYPGSHYVVKSETMKRAISGIKQELNLVVEQHRSNNKLVEAQRLEQRTMFDLEMMKNLGYCNGIENYSRYLTGRKAGDPPPTLLDYLSNDSLIIIDESHVSMGQIRGMYAGDRSRKMTLVDYGFRLPSALDNRPLNLEEFESDHKQRIYISATPADYELELASENVIQLLVRPTGLIDPEVDIRPVTGQVDDVIHESRERAGRDERTLITTLTKRFSEDLTEYMSEAGLRVKYMHSDIDTLERTEILRELRLGEFDTLIGINLLREGLDLPEVSLVAILDADKEGFLRSERSLIQTSGRAARNVNGKVIMYADKITGSMQRAMDEMERRRKIQKEYNNKYNVKPQSIQKSVYAAMTSHMESVPMVSEEQAKYGTPKEVEKMIGGLEKEMHTKAKELNFERAAELRDKIKELKQLDLLYK